MKITSAFLRIRIDSSLLKRIFGEGPIIPLKKQKRSIYEKTTNLVYLYVERKIRKLSDRHF